MSASSCARADDLAAYALGALDEREEAGMSAHIEGCDHCRERLRWLAPALETLPESVEQIDPPSRLRRELMKTVQADAEAEPPPATSRGWRDLRVRFGGFAFGPATALAAVLVLVAAGVGYEAADTDSEGRTVAASGPPGSEAELQVGGGQATFVAEEVPPLPRGDVYQVWVRRGSKVEASTSFRPDAAGGATAPIPEAAHDADQVMITREPRSSQRPAAPTSAPLYSATLD
jgi:anti-sigma factor RsiW